MNRAETGWNWFEALRPAGAETAATSGDQGLANAAARCFCSPDGQRVIKHLRAFTLERTLGPGASETMLRHLEGQRSLVAYLIKLSAQGLRSGALSAPAAAMSEPEQETAVVTRSNVDE